MSSHTEPPVSEADCRSLNNKLGRRMRSLWWPGRRLELATESFALGQACRQVGCTGLAAECFQRVRILLPSKHPDASKTALASFALLAASHNHLGMMSLDECRPDDARPELEEAVRIRSELRDLFPEERENEVYLGGALCNLGHSLADSHPRQAAGYYEQSLAVLRHPTRGCNCSYWDEARQSWWCEQLESLGDVLGLQWVFLAPCFIDNALQGLASLTPDPGPPPQSQKAE
ncbi:MAG: hypothetical protein JWL81_3050 [Verrucomicrobiales bacterium]|nr:hypothetical protein [Verrucomicrobiales bacterium]